MGHVLGRVRRQKLGVPQSSRDIFSLLTAGRVISERMAEARKQMVDYRKLVVHDYQNLLLPVTVAMITRHLSELLAISERMVRSLDA